MAAAEVGDDVLGEDPTVNALEERAAELLGKEAGLFVSSGTMGNLVSLMAHVPRGGEIIAGAQSHIVRDEAAGHAVVVGASVLQLRDRPDGSLDPGEIARRVPRPVRSARADHQPRRDRERPQPLGQPAARRRHHGRDRGGRPRARRAAPRRRRPVLQCGASRSASGRRSSRGPADSVTFCLSKGLACPVGSRRRRVAAVHRPGPPRPEAPRRRDAPGRACSRRPGSSRCGTATPG